jgi:hypothetical protein
LCKYSPCGDAGIIHCFELGNNGGLGKYLFTATNAELMGENRAEKAQQAQEKQKSVKRAAREIEKLTKTMASEAGEVATTADILPFPLPKEDFESAALAAASAALEALIPQEPPQPTEEELAAMEAERKRLERQERKLQALEDPGDKYIRLYRALKGGEQLCEEDLLFMERFESRSEGRIMKRTLEADVSIS